MIMNWAEILTTLKSLWASFVGCYISRENVGAAFQLAALLGLRLLRLSGYRVGGQVLE